MIALDADGHRVGDRIEGAHDRLGKGDFRKKGDDPHQAFLKEQWVADKGNDAFPARPFLVAELRVTDDAVGQIGAAFAADDTQLVRILLDIDATVVAVRVREHPGTGSELESLFGIVERPYPDEGRLGACFDRFGADLQRRGHIRNLRQCLADGRPELGQACPLGKHLLSLPALGYIPHNGRHVIVVRGTVAVQGNFHRDPGAAFRKKNGLHR